MQQPLFCTRSDLADLAQEKPLLFDVAAGRSTGVRLVKLLGAGGMSAVFLGELEPEGRASWPVITPGRLAIKLIKPSALADLARWNLDGVDIAEKEARALMSVHGEPPLPEFVVRFFGKGLTAIQVGAAEPMTLPWIALEYIDGGNAGSTLRDRVESTRDEGIDPVRARRLVRGIIEGVRAFHKVDIIHRDIKPENVFVTGPIDNETPKIGDCGIARVDTVAGRTVHAMTGEYAGPEQNLSVLVPAVRNPLIGPWSDVHALAATVWFLLAGETWFRAPTEWNQGVRRSLSTASRMHCGFKEEFNENAALREELDAVLQRGGAPCLPDGTWQLAKNPAYEARARVAFPGMFPDDPRAPKRYASVDAFASDLLPILERCAARWAGRDRKGAPLTRFRETRLPSDLLRGNAGPRSVLEIEPPRVPVPTPVDPSGVVFLTGADGYARAGDHVYYFSQVDPFHVQIPVPPAYRECVRSSRWICRGSEEGFALVGPTHILSFPQYDFKLLPLPHRGAKKGAVGEIRAVFTDSRGLGIVTDATDDGGGVLELWRSPDGASWRGPVPLTEPFDVSAVASGPQGLLIIGGSKGRNARAILIGHGDDDEPTTPNRKLVNRPPLLVAVAGGEGESWAAGEGIVLRFDPSGVSPEPVDSTEAPVAMALDPVGVPWLLTGRAVLRRYGLGAPRWRVYHEMDRDAPPLVAIGFTPMGARLVDAQGGGALLEPEDIDAWRE